MSGHHPPSPARGREVSRLDDLLARTSDRRVIEDAPGKSGALLERVIVDGAPHMLKFLDLGRDWTMRASGVLRGATCELWWRWLLDRLPGCLDQPVVDVAVGEVEPGRRVTAVLMRDVGASLVQVGEEPIDLDVHRTLLHHAAALHAAFWDAGPEIDVVTPLARFLELSPVMAETEAARGGDPLVPRLVGEGWPLLATVAPRAAAVVGPLARDPSPLVTALAGTPQTLVHGNLKLDNLGIDAEGRTVLLDWETSGRGAPTFDLAWYLAINCRRLPESKEDTIAAYRASLEEHGVPTQGWWDEQLALSLLGGLVLFGWEKAFGGLDDELLWWQEHAIAGAALLHP
ncbi:MAG: phosphotransferase [Frankiales bacterium]|nr:phosphotransferase [Frankiales bacterium]